MCMCPICALTINNTHKARSDAHILQPDLYLHKYVTYQNKIHIIFTSVTMNLSQLTNPPTHGSTFLYTKRTHTKAHSNKTHSKHKNSKRSAFKTNRIQNKAHSHKNAFKKHSAFKTKHIQAHVLEPDAHIHTHSCTYIHTHVHTYTLMYINARTHKLLLTSCRHICALSSLRR
jgi:hypothetical protein